MRRLIIVLFSLFIFIELSPAQESSTRESWYLYFGLGYANPSYSADVQSMLDTYKLFPDLETTTISLDLIGIYWHLSPKTIAGPVINGIGDRYDIGGYWIQLNQYIYGASVIHYPGENFGSGLFLRADVGLARLVQQSSSGGLVSSDTGAGLLVGSGWSFDLGGTRLLLNVNYAFRLIERESYGTFAVSLGGLF